MTECISLHVHSDWESTWERDRDTDTDRERNLASVKSYLEKVSQGCWYEKEPQAFSTPDCSGEQVSRRDLNDSGLQTNKKSFNLLKENITSLLFLSSRAQVHVVRSTSFC